jgi:hypothetical protein
MDARGFRRLRPGAEGLLKLFLNGIAPDGHLNEARLPRERTRELLHEDPIGANEAAKLFGSAEKQVLELVEGFLAGQWDRTGMLRLQAHLRHRLILEPGVVVRRLWSRIGQKRKCKGIKLLLKAGQLRPGDRAALRRLAETHPARPWT